MGFAGQAIVHLARHGEYDPCCLSLTPKGHYQSQELGKALDSIYGRGPYLTHILSSKEQRAIETVDSALKTKLTIQNIKVIQSAELRGIFALPGELDSDGRPKLKALLDPLIAEQDHVEVLMVTHRRFLCNVLQNGEWKLPE